MNYYNARPTVYKGIRMRSRREATFAAWLDGEELRWDYEPACFADTSGQYLPDFRLHLGGEATAYYEVKPPKADISAALLKMHVIRASEPHANLFVVIPTGNYPNQGWATVGKCVTGQKCAHCQGAVFHDARTIPNADRRAVPADPGGRARIGGRARREDGTSSSQGRAIAGRARRDVWPP